MDITLTIPEEIFLLSIDAEGNQLENKEFDVVLASSILMELALQNRIDTDLDFVIPDQPTLTTNVMLDEILSVIHASEKKKSISHWIIYIYSQIDRVKKNIISGLVQKKVIRIENERLLFVFSSKKFPIIKQKEIIEVKLRVRELIFNNDIPELREIVLISLIHYGSIEFVLFTDEESQEYRERISQIAKMDMIGQVISRIMSEITMAIRAKVLLRIKSAEQRMDDLIEKFKLDNNVKSDVELPEWLKKGTVQYHKTLHFMDETGATKINYNAEDRTYLVLED